MNRNDIVFLKALNVSGFVCHKNYKCTLDSIISENKFKCKVSNNGFIIIQKRDILKVIDSTTNEVVYQDTMEDGL